MIQVSRLNGSVFFINPIHIENFEETPDTVITLTNGKKLIVRENAESLIEQLRAFYHSVGGLKVVIQYQSQEHPNE
ncbi:hypothetical protein BHU72_03335 [Desulfuribacillus stibiiarsenatis]|uniref:Flagellar protein FlbD n=1 Tax=Desulfuribacillus stibiiarsenatis TaxID=1390249 RepID=A0A1E5L6N8_9FIRM|nr:flagellar FlbD family protein [Desulfuribacillus stibiiarsenatis]OEH85827.1 hypothetical protein BHU72_03335 [Desulfuribacillus stibiiarsenatis]